MKSLAPVVFNLILLLGFITSELKAQVADCPYPIIFLHGWTGDQYSFFDTYSDTYFQNAFGALGESQVFYTMNNATTATYLWGGAGTNDDDVLVSFSNENNILPPACVYAINQDNSVQFSGSSPAVLKNSGSAIAFNESDSNESALYKQGYTVKSMIQQVLAANPSKDKVIVVGHSMGGLAIREYLQRKEGSNHTWWVNPGKSDGHQIIKAMTTVTPHGGSNTLGNISGLRGEADNSRDGLPDLFSEAVRDMRYSWACGFLGLSDCTGAYLYGGDEDAGFGWWNEDANCDGDESDTDIVGINIDGTSQGFSEVWDGTYDNPSMPLPTNLRYTYLTSDIIGFDGDGVVAMDRQWPHSGSTPRPTDGVAGRLSDTLFTNAFHTNANDDADVVVRGIDEGDYPAFVWDIQTETDYVNLANYRASNVNEGTSSQDPDWYRFFIPSGYNGDLRIDITPNSGVATRVDFFGNAPANYTAHSTNTTQNITIPLGSNSLTSLEVLNTHLNIGGFNYFRLRHTNVDFTDWRQPIIVAAKLVTILPVEWGVFTAELIDEKTSALFWSSQKEENLSHYEVAFSKDGIHFTAIGRQYPLAEKKYTFQHHNIPFGTLFYRIKSVDFDGFVSYSTKVTLKNKASGWMVQNIYPQPAKTLVELAVYAPDNTFLNYKLFNNQGQLLKQSSRNLLKGDNYISIDIRDLPTGVFMLLLEDNTQQIWKKVIKV